MQHNPIGIYDMLTIWTLVVLVSFIRLLHDPLPELPQLHGPQAPLSGCWRGRTGSSATTRPILPRSWQKDRTPPHTKLFVPDLVMLIIFFVATPIILCTSRSSPDRRTSSLFFFPVNSNTRPPLVPGNAYIYNGVVVLPDHMHAA